MVWAVSLSTTNLIARSLTAMLNATGIRSLANVSNLVGPIGYPVLYLRCAHTTLHLNAFRGEPAITEFDWPFTPIHRSSPPFSTEVGSVLHAVLPALQPAHG
jgi:hypothetical protein